MKFLKICLPIFIVLGLGIAKWLECIRGGYSFEVSSVFDFLFQAVLVCISYYGVLVAASALAISNETLKEQKKSGELQRFDTTFFNMMDLQEQITGQLLIVCKCQESEVDSTTNHTTYKDKYVIKNGREAIECLWINKYVNYVDLNGHWHGYDGLNKALYGSGIKHYWEFSSVSTLDHYFRHMYRIVKFVDGAKCLNDEEKYKYVAILRATLSRCELVLLFYNGLSEAGREKFKPLMEKYSLLQNLREDYLTTSREVMENKPLRMLVANNYKGCKDCMDYYAYMTDEEVENNEYEDKGKIPPYNISVFAKKGSVIYEKILKDYNDYKRAHKACKET